MLTKLVEWWRSNSVHLASKCPCVFTNKKKFNIFKNCNFQLEEKEQWYTSSFTYRMLLLLIHFVCRRFSIHCAAHFSCDLRPLSGFCVAFVLCYYLCYSFCMPVVLSSAFAFVWPFLATLLDIYMITKTFLCAPTRSVTFCLWIDEVKVPSGLTVLEREPLPLQQQLKAVIWMSWQLSGPENNVWDF